MKSGVKLLMPARVLSRDQGAAHALTWLAASACGRSLSRPVCGIGAAGAIDGQGRRREKAVRLLSEQVKVWAALVAKDLAGYGLRAGLHAGWGRWSRRLGDSPETSRRPATCRSVEP